jgi:broad specificity phosphatase PhoE
LLARAVHDGAKLKTFEQLGDSELLGKYGVEPVSSVIRRAYEVLNIVRNIDAKRLVLVGHGAFFRHMINVLIPNSPAATLRNGCCHNITFNGDGGIGDYCLNQTWPQLDRN